MVKNPPAKQEMEVRSLGQEDPLEKEIATHSCTLAWEIPWTEELGGLQSTGSQRVRHNLVTQQQQQQGKGRIAAEAGGSAGSSSNCGHLTGDGNKSTAVGQS